MLAQYNDLTLTLNLSATCMESVLYNGNIISHVVILGYGICMYVSAFFKVYLGLIRNPLAK